MIDLFSIEDFFVHDDLECVVCFGDGYVCEDHLDKS